jgi:hypothetical protein
VVEEARRVGHDKRWCIHLSGSLGR